ncbi:unnamed protein product [Ceratitis capitata]|uniref:(Mediterranean fruit fly) hypothetical protein n=1 Tax=Ceratitis capitata TaxID=7213 RepID=A0A811U1N7_CERCA|nr:unnamed protein product [Ceratitis capitata]
MHPHREGLSAAHISRLLSVCFVICVLSIRNTKCEVYTALAEMEELLETESVLITNLDGYLKVQQQKLDYLKNYGRLESELGSCSLTFECLQTHGYLYGHAGSVWLLAVLKAYTHRRTYWVSWHDLKRGSYASPLSFQPHMSDCTHSQTSKRLKPGLQFVASTFGSWSSEFTDSRFPTSAVAKQ